MLSPVYGRWVALSAVAYVVLHHLGLLPGGLGSAPDDTEWADWLDLLVPFLVLAPVAAALQSAPATSATWWLFGGGAVTYATGHGVHLAANSVANADPGPTAHLWDEGVGHLVWYAGVVLVAVALVRTMEGRPRPSPLGYLLAGLVGLTWATNALGATDALVVLGLLVALVATAYGWRRRRELGVVLVAAGGVGAIVLVGGQLVAVV